ncbi:hypothetical protein CQ012_07760 [Arthrobacter sp. MYb214]|uniref:tyrosine-type recombinase/integrase n=1 Tax=Arthrobacter sp. MYb214 TaxID=1848596 RepID=UPI000CFB5052|nr:tyrosine-type recombinase/integrase [Arthrobacter sp. MYb214]PRB76888.1 hypothetical protein CQ012_07760 [Arthrobacter sp. MYb214]
MAAVVKNPNGNGYIADYYTPEGKRKRRVFKLKREAEAHLTEVAAATRDGSYVDPNNAKGITVAALHSRWLKVIAANGATGRRGCTLSTKETYEKIYRNQIKPHWEYRPIASIKHGDVTDWLEAMSMANGSPASASAKSKALKQFSRMFDYAVTEGLLGKNPARNRAGRVMATPTPKPTRSQVRLTMAQLIRVADASRDYRLLVLLTGLTGLRWSEVTTLRRKHLDYGEIPTALVEASVAKNHEERTVPIPATIATELEALTLEAGPEDLVFRSPRGGQLNSSNFHERHYDPAAKAAASAVGAVQRRLGVKGETKRETSNGNAVQLGRYGERTQAAVRAFQETEGLEATGAVTRPVWAALGLEEYGAMTLALGDSDFIPPTFHNLRHTAVSLAIRAGANIKVVQRIAGHKSATMTLDVYGDLFADDLADSAKRLDAELSTLLG